MPMVDDDELNSIPSRVAEFDADEIRPPSLGPGGLERAKSAARTVKAVAPALR